MILIVGKCVVAASLFSISVVLVGNSYVGHSLKLNHPVLLAQDSVTRESNLVAVHEEKLSKMDREAQAGEDDRKVLHAAIATLTDRINVDEAEARTASRMFGWLFSLFTAVSTLVALLEYRRKNKL